MSRKERRREEKLAKGRKTGPAQTGADEITALLQKATTDHQNGKLHEALDGYQAILNIAPGHGEVLYLAGTALLQLGDIDQSIKVLSAAAQANPAHCESHSNLGIALRLNGEFEKSIAACKRAVEINGSFADAQNNLGAALSELGRVAEASGAYHRAIELRADYSEAIFNLANLNYNENKLEAAESLYRRLLEINPANDLAHNALGILLKKSGHRAEAISSFQRAIELRPANHEAWLNFGNLLQEEDHFNEAADAYMKALEAKPGYDKAYNNLANVRQKQGKYEEAESLYRSAIENAPKSAEAHNNFAGLMKETGRLEEAESSYRKAIELRADYTDAHRNLLFTLLNIPRYSQEELFQEHLRFAAQHMPPEPQILTFANAPDPREKLKIAYFSSDLKKHPVGRNLMPLLATHDRNKYEVFGYSEVTNPDEGTAAIKALCDHWRETLGRSDSEVAAMMRADEIDIAVYLAGHFDKNRPEVCAWRGAPVQVSFHDGATSGFEAMDYWLTDSVLHPENTSERFTEELYRLPVFYQYPPPHEAPPVTALPADENGYITFASFNNPAKVTEPVLALWAKVLKVVPESRLLLKYRNLMTLPAIQDRWTDCFSANGISADRLLFHGSWDPLEKHLALYGQADIALDTFPFNGATTSFEALIMGVPVITLMGENFVSRTAASLVTHAGLPEMATSSEADYIAIAKTMSNDLPRLREIRAGLRQRIINSPLCDAKAYTDSIESAYRYMWDERERTGS